MYVTQQETITFNEQEYKVAELSDKIKSLVVIWTKWKNELTDQKLEAEKTGAALKALEAELVSTLTAELTPPAAEAEVKEVDAPTA